MLTRSPSLFREAARQAGNHEPHHEENDGADAKMLDFKQYLNDSWKYAMDDSDTRLETAQKREKKGRKDNAKE